MTGSVGYGRQSHGSQKSISEQGDRYSKRRKEEGWHDRGFFTDKTSASKYAARARSDWPKLLKMLTGPDVNVLWLWESSRGDRKASTWLQLLETCEEHGVRLFVETHERLLDVSNAIDWKALASDGVDSELESRKTARRINRHVDAQIEDGRPPARPGSLWVPAHLRAG